MDGGKQGRLDQREISDWETTHVGLPQEGWVCPSAPKPVRLPYGQVGTSGTVNSAEVWVWPPYPPTNRVSSYGLNDWLGGSRRLAGTSDPVFSSRLSMDQLKGFFYDHESQLIQSSLTPILADAVITSDLGGPLPWEKPALDPVYGGLNGGGYSGVMAQFTIPRHGNRLSPQPKQWDISKPLSGAINVGFFDGSARQVPLEQLWQLYWSADWQPPAKRPGLK